MSNAIEIKNELYKKALDFIEKIKIDFADEQIKNAALDFIEKIKIDFADEQIKNAYISGIVDMSVVINFKSGLRITMRTSFNEGGSMCYEEYGASNINTHAVNVRSHSYNELIGHFKGQPLLK